MNPPVLRFSLCLSLVPLLSWHCLLDQVWAWNHWSHESLHNMVTGAHCSPQSFCWSSLASGSCLLCCTFSPSFSSHHVGLLPQILLYTVVSIS